MIGGATKLVALLGRPVAESLSPRMQNAAFAARALDWAYVPLEVGPEELREAVAGLVAGDYAGANVTIPHKQAVVELCDEAEGESVNTLLFRDGRVLGYNTDKAIVAGIESRSVCLLGAGGAAKALLPALQGEVHMFSRKGDWPPDASGCDLIVNATPVRDELLVRATAGAGRGRPRLSRRRSADGARRFRARALAPGSSSTGSRHSCGKVRRRFSCGPASSRRST